jgi:hypothetical protein
MPTCPHCKQEICTRKLPHPGLFKNYRNCPDCEGRFTPDIDTKYRQAIFIFMALISLAFTMLMYMGATEWLVPAIFSYVILALLIYWGNKLIYFVPYQNKEKAPGDS